MEGSYYVTKKPRRKKEKKEPPPQFFLSMDFKKRGWEHRNDHGTSQ